MKLKRRDSEIMEATLTTDHSASSYGQPVLVTETGEAIGTADVAGCYVVDATPEEDLDLTEAGYQIPDGEDLARDLGKMLADEEDLETCQGRLEDDLGREPTPEEAAAFLADWRSVAGLDADGRPDPENRVSFRPLDTGFDVRLHDMAVVLPEETTVVEYLDGQGPDAVPAEIRGTRPEMIAALRAAGYAVAEGDQAPEPERCEMCGTAGVELRDVRRQTNPQSIRWCRICWDKVSIMAAFDPMAGGGILGSDWSEEEEGDE